MAETKPAKKSTRKTTVKAKASTAFSAEEKLAMRERIRELKADADKANEEGAVLAKIASMSAPDRAMAKRLHAVIKGSAPDLSPKLWYGMPAYYKDGKMVCFFQDARKFKTRYSTLGFSDAANLDDGGMWPSAFALKKLGATEEARIRGLLKKAVSD
ncbi:MAG TPA: hypothetical protein VGG90_12275 [Candidatus Dormibacteraeota bacterium]